jgi:hypothetical protein
MEIGWRILTMAVEQLKNPPRMLQDLIFKNRNPNEADTIDVDIVVGGRKLAPFVTDVEGGKIVSGSTRSERSVKTPRIRLKDPLTAKKLRSERGVGQPFYATGPKSVEEAEQAKIMRSMKELKNKVLTTIEWMCAQALTGKILVQQDNIEFEVDYQMPPDHKITLAGDARWNVEGDTSDPLNDMQAWNDKIVDKLGYGATLMILGTEAAKAFRKKVPKDAWMDVRRVDAGKLVWEMSSNYMGNIGGIDIYRYGSSFDDASGSPQQLIGADKAYMVATDARISIEFGNILDLDANVVGEFFAKNWKEKDPSVLWNLVESRPLPVLWEPEAVIEADVL